MKKKAIIIDQNHKGIHPYEYNVDSDVFVLNKDNTFSFKGKSIHHGVFSLYDSVSTWYHSRVSTPEYITYIEKIYPHFLKKSKIHNLFTTTQSTRTIMNLFHIKSPQHHLVKKENLDEYFTPETLFEIFHFPFVIHPKDRWNHEVKKIYSKDDIRKLYQNGLLKQEFAIEDMVEGTTFIFFVVDNIILSYDNNTKTRRIPRGWSYDQVYTWLKHIEYTLLLQNAYCIVAKFDEQKVTEPTVLAIDVSPYISGKAHFFENELKDLNLWLDIV